MTEAPKVVDEFASSVFADMGYSNKLPDSLVIFYNEFKARKDKLQAGRLSPEAFASISLLSDLQDGKINFPEQE